MYSLNINNIGTPAFNIEGGKYNGKTVCISDKNEEDENDLLYRDFQALTLTDGKFAISLDVEKGQRLVITLFGMSGSGKTYYLNDILKKMINSWGTSINNILFFSKKNIEDEDSISNNIKHNKKFHQINLLDETMIVKPYDLMNDEDKREFQDSIVIFDDISTLSSRDKLHKKIKENVVEIQHDLLEVSRYLNTTILITEHSSCSGTLSSKTLVNESTHYVLFPQNGMGVYFRLLNHYLGLNKKQIDKLKDMCSDSRTLVIRKSVPSMYMTEKRIGFLKDI